MSEHPWTDSSPFIKMLFRFKAFMEIQAIFFRQILNNIIHKIPYDTNTFVFELAMLFIETHNRILYLMQKYGEPLQFQVHPFTLDETQHTFPQYGNTAYVSPATTPQPTENAS